MKSTLEFFLLENNDLKNVNTIFNENNLKINKILLKNYSEGVQIINLKDSDTFLRIKIGKETSSIILFDQSSFKYGQSFNFGSNIIRLKPPTVPMLPFVMLPRPLQESNVVGKGGTAGSPMPANNSNPIRRKNSCELDARSCTTTSTAGAPIATICPIARRSARWPGSACNGLAHPRPRRTLRPRRQPRWAWGRLSI